MAAVLRMQTPQERLMDQALDRALAPAVVIRAQQPLLRPRFGYSVEQPTIYDVVGLQRYRAPSQWEYARSNWAGNAGAEINASARNAGGMVLGST